MEVLRQGGLDGVFHALVEYGKIAIGGCDVLLRVELDGYIRPVPYGRPHVPERIFSLAYLFGGGVRVVLSRVVAVLGDAGGRGVELLRYGEGFFSHEGNVVGRVVERVPEVYGGRGELAVLEDVDEVPRGLVPDRFDGHQRVAGFAVLIDCDREGSFRFIGLAADSVRKDVLALFHELGFLGLLDLGLRHAPPGVPYVGRLVARARRRENGEREDRYRGDWGVFHTGRLGYGIYYVRPMGYLQGRQARPA